LVAALHHPAGYGRDAVRRRRHDHLLDLGRVPGHAQHPRHRVPVDVRVEQADLLARGGHGHGQVHGHRRLAHAALAAGHRVHLGQRVRLGERDDALRLAAPERGLQLAALLLAHHVQLDPDSPHAVELADRGGHVPGDGVAQRTAGHGQEDVDPDGTVASHLDVLDHAEIGDRTVDLRVVDAGERLGDLLYCWRRRQRRRDSHATNATERPRARRNEQPPGPERKDPGGGYGRAGARRARERMPSMAELQQIGLRHPAADLVRDIQRNRTGIPRRTFVAEGLFENNVVLEAGVTIDTFLWGPEAAYSDEAQTRSSQLAARARRAYRISEKTLAYLTERPNPDGLISIARLPDTDPEAFAFGPSALVLVIDGIEIPGNLGTLIRTADACAADCLVLTNRRTRLTHPKVLRSSQGMSIRVPAIEFDAVP